MQQTVVIIALEVAFTKLPVGFPSVTASSVAGRVVLVLASSEVAGSTPWQCHASQTFEGPFFQAGKVCFYVLGWNKFCLWTRPDNTRDDDIAIKTTQTSKVTAVVTVMIIFSKKRCNPKNSKPRDEKPSCQKAESANFPEENSRGPRILSQKMRKKTVST